MGFGIQPGEFEYGPFLQGSPGEGKHPWAWLSAGVRPNTCSVVRLTVRWGTERTVLPIGCSVFGC
jgi:hypothetical protein